MTRLRFLRLLGMAPMARYGSMGQMHRRPDQQTDAPPSAVAPTQAAGILRARAVVIFGTGPSAGLFVYNGTPALGNPPQVAIVPTGVTKDPFGNAITSSKILIQGNIITESGGIFRTSATAPLIQLDGPRDAVLIYDSGSNLIITETPAAGNDGLGNTFPAGITTFQPGPNRAQNFVQLINNTIVFGLSPNTFSLSPGANGLVVTGAFAYTEQAAPSAIGSGPQVFGSNVTGMARFLADNTKGDSEAYDTGTNHRDNASAVTLSNTVFTSVFADMPIAALKYRVNADLVVQMGAVSTTLLLKLVGPAVAAVTSVKWRATAEAGTVISAGHSSGSLASVTTVAWAINAVVHVWMSADVSFTAASGTNLNLQAQLGAASATTQVLAGSTMDVSPVG